MRIGHLFALLGLAVGCAPNSEPTPTDAGVVVDPATVLITLGDALKGIEGRGPLKAKLTTDAGFMEIRLHEEKAPRAVANFVALARGLRPAKDAKTGAWVKRPFYDGLLFHRVIPGFMIQTGCPRGDGRGGPGYVFDDEFSEDLKHDGAGVVAMVNAGPDTNGSQFYITDAPAPHLDGRNTIF
ncbi:MAG: peptidylprolyl isomerase, partial [Myxococcota bacterium]